MSLLPIFSLATTPVRVLGYPTMGYPRSCNLHLRTQAFCFLVPGRLLSWTSPLCFLPLVVPVEMPPVGGPDHPLPSN